MQCEGFAGPWHLASTPDYHLIKVINLCTLHSDRRKMIAYLRSRLAFHSTEFVLELDKREKELNDLEALEASIWAQMRANVHRPIGA